MRVISFSNSQWLLIIHKQCFLNTMKGNKCNFIKPCIRIYINSTNTYSRRERARSQLDDSYFPL